MVFRYIVETVNKNGLKERAVREIDKTEILLGRGTASDILLYGRRVSLNHAKLTVRDDGELHVDDLESLSGVLVNRRVIQHQLLRKGDTLEIGSYSFEVIKDEQGWGLLERRDPSLADDGAERLVAEQAHKLRFQSYLPSFTILSTLISLIVLVLFGALPLSGANRTPWNSGPISNHHGMISASCEQCHQEPFVRVKDEQCAACHSMSDHAQKMPAVFQNHPQLENRCATCHMEHNGDHGLIASESALCTDCHGKLDTILPGTGVQQIRSFENHPEFRVTVASAVEGQTERLSLRERTELKDPTALKLNHQLHLKEGLTGPSGPTTLNCYDCHRPNKPYLGFKPIEFERDCQSCHPLEFDPRLPGASVPHGDAEVVYNYLYAQYAKLFLSSEGEADPFEAAAGRRRPGSGNVTRGQKVEFSRSSVESESRSVEESIFTRTACQLCHMVNPKEPGAVGEEAGEGEVQEVVADGGSRYQVVLPQVPVDWMPHARFDHGAHQAVTCESCHQSVRTSTETADVLLPGIDGCRECHTDGSNRSAGTPEMVRSECISCHSFHEPLLLSEEQKRGIEKILLSEGGGASPLLGKAAVHF